MHISRDVAYCYKHITGYKVIFTPLGQFNTMNDFIIYTNGRKDKGMRIPIRVSLILNYVIGNDEFLHATPWIPDGEK